MSGVGNLLKNSLPKSDGERLVRTLQRAYDAAYAGLKEDQELHSEHHSPAGEVFRVRGLILDPNTDAWLIDGQSERTGERCRVFAPVGTMTHVVLRAVEVEEGEPERKPIGFTVDRDGRETKRLPD